MRIKCLRIFPETMPRISASELSSRSLNMALGKAMTTVASTSMGSDLATGVLLRKSDGGRGAKRVSYAGERVRTRRTRAVGVTSGLARAGQEHGDEAGIGAYG